MNTRMVTYMWLSINPFRVKLATGKYAAGCGGLQQLGSSPRALSGEVSERCDAPRLEQRFAEDVAKQTVYERDAGGSPVRSFNRFKGENDTLMARARLVADLFEDLFMTPVDCLAPKAPRAMQQVKANLDPLHDFARRKAERG